MHIHFVRSQMLISIIHFDEYRKVYNNGRINTYIRIKQRPSQNRYGKQSDT